MTGLGTADVEEADEKWVVDGADECGAAGSVEEDGCLSCAHNTVSMQTHQETRSERQNRMEEGEGKEKKAANEGDQGRYRCVARKRPEQRHGVLSPTRLKRSARIEQSPSAEETEDRSRGAAQKSFAFPPRATNGENSANGEASTSRGPSPLFIADPTFTNQPQLRAAIIQRLER